MKHQTQSGAARVRRQIVLHIVATATGGTIAIADPPMYSISVLPGPPLRLWNAYDLGPQGQVIGRTVDFNVTPALIRGFVWHNGAFTFLTGSDGETVTEARCMDDNGVIYGGAIDRRYPVNLARMHAVRWVNGVAERFANETTTNTSFIFGCSPTSGIAVGWAKPHEPGASGWRGEYGYANEANFGTAEPVRAFIWSGGNGRVLTRGISAHGEGAFDVNDSGQAAITLDTFELGGAARFDPRFGMMRLPGLGVGEPGTRAAAINESGQIAGHALAPGGVEHPVVWTADRIVDLGLLPGFVEGNALDIDDAGTVVGGLSTQNFAFGLRNTIGFIYFQGVMHDLNTRIPTTPGFVIHEAVSINSAGQILVVMNPPPLSNNRYAVLTPINP